MSKFVLDFNAPQSIAWSQALARLAASIALLPCPAGFCALAGSRW